ncbi:MAG TPA: hypothetical protein VHH34_19905 [Pseudonocardiaceae bacterium]|nr:hypothetical protein [Pseudonocardiaceae bacterium]
MFEERTQHLVADLLHRLAPGTWVDVVWEADGAVLDLPIELLRLTAASGEDLGPLALCGGVTVLRRVAGAPGGRPARSPAR